MANLQKDLDACNRTIKAMSDELGTELLSQLNFEDQQEVFLSTIFIYNIL